MAYQLILPRKDHQPMDNAKPIYTLKRITVFIVATIMLMLTMAGCGNQEIPDEPIDTEPTVTTTEPTTVTTTEPTTTEPPVTEPPLPEPLEKYNEYYEKNSDFIGYMVIPNLTNSSGEPYVDYPIVHTDDNSFYLDKDFDKEKDKAGWIYADYKIPITETDHADNITFYGHSMKDGSFFRHLLDYKSSSKGLDLINRAYTIKFDTRWEENEYVIIGCFLTGIYDWQDEEEELFEYFKTRRIKTQEEFDYFYDNVMLRSYYTSDIECEFGDEFITLSTCAYDFDDSRWVVVARKVREGEDPSQYAGTYEKNRTRHMPSILD